MIRIWNAEELRHLYYDRNMTLRDIAPIYSVSFERIRQVMKELSIPTIKHRQHKPHKPLTPRFKGLADYLARGKDHRPTMHHYLPEEARQCSECGSDRFILIHHIIYPATSLEDIQILCRSCHKIKHNGKMPYLRQLDLYNDYLNGLRSRTLRHKYGISRALVDRIVHKIKHGLTALKR